MDWVIVANVPGDLGVTKAWYSPEYITFGRYTLQVGSDIIRQGQTRNKNIKLFISVFSFTRHFNQSNVYYQLFIKYLNNNLNLSNIKCWHNNSLKQHRNLVPFLAMQVIGLVLSSSYHISNIIKTASNPIIFLFAKLQKKTKSRSFQIKLSEHRLKSYYIS